MSDAWCADCGSQMVELFKVWDGPRQKRVCWECSFSYGDDEPEEEADVLEMQKGLLP